jgi:SET domain-containing protein
MFSRRTRSGGGVVQDLGPTGSEEGLGFLLGVPGSRPRLSIEDAGAAGRGVFAAEDIPRGTVVTQYAGQLRYAKNHALALTRASHTIGLFTVGHVDASRLVIDGFRFSGLRRWFGVGSMVNDGPTPNCAFVRSDLPARCLVRTTADVRAGSELLARYGSSYWCRATIPGK